MRTIASLLLVVLLVGTGPASAQPGDTSFEVELEPVAYILGGAGGHVGVQAGAWNYTIEVFGLEIPESFHGNDGFDASPLGIELHAAHFFGNESRGFYAGPEVGMSRLKVTHRASGESTRRTQYSIGLRGGYRWYPGIASLYLSPVVGFTYALNSASIDIEQETFESSPFTPFATVGLGWSF